MILLAQVSEVAELQRLKLLFERNGILIHTANEHSARNYGMFHPSGKYALFVALEEQYQDAQLLLKDEHHRVKSPIDLKQITALEQSKKYAVMATLLKQITLIAVVLVSVIALTIWYVIAANS
jgi:hypothetical protein